MTGRLGLAIIGLGPASLPHAKSLLDLAGQRGAALGGEPHAGASGALWRPRSRSRPRPIIDAVLADPAWTPCIVLTPPSSHLDVAAACLERGKHVLVEKPLELTSERGAALVAGGPPRRQGGSAWCCSTASARPACA